VKLFQQPVRLGEIMVVAVQVLANLLVLVVVLALAVL
jgi:hypothetical protein